MSRAALPSRAALLSRTPLLATTASAATAATVATAAMASPTVLTFDAGGRAVDLDVWVDDLQLFLQCDSRDGVSLFDHTSSVSTAPAAPADSTVRSQWTTRDAVARLAVRSHLPSAERAHFGQYKTAQSLYDVVVARYSSPSTAALSRLMLPYLFPDLAAFATVADLIAHLHTSDAHYRAALPTEDHFLSLCPTDLIVDLLEERLTAAEKSILAIGASRGDPHAPFFEGCSPIPLLPSVASAVAIDLVGTAEVGAAFAPSGRRRNSKGKGARVVEGTVGAAVEAVEEAEGVAVEVGLGAGVGALVAAVGVVEAAAAALEAAAAVVEVAAAVVLVTVEPRSMEALVWYAGRGRSGGVGPCTYVLHTGGRRGEMCGLPHTAQCFFGRLTDAWRAQFPGVVELPRWGDLLKQNVAIFDLDFDAILAAMYAATDSAEGDCYLCVPPDPGIEVAALGASESTALGTSESVAPGAGESALSSTAPTEALRTFTLDSGASRSFFRDNTTITPLRRSVAVSLADPSGGPVLAHSSTVLPCPAAPSGLLSGLHLPSFSPNLVSGADLQDAWVDQFTPGGQRVTQCTCSRTGRHLATFTRRPGSSLYTPTTSSPPVTVSGQVAASGQVLTAASRSSPASAPCSCRPLSHETLLWHHRLGHPSLPRLRGMASRTLVSGLPRSLPPLPPGPAPTCVPCVEGRQRAAPHSSKFPPTEAPLQTLHMDVWGPARVRGQGHKRYFLLVVDDYSRYTTVFPLRRKDRGAEFSSDLLRAFCRAEGICQTFTLPASPQQNGIAERYIGIVMDVARTSMIHAAAPHFLWPFAVQYAAHQINLQPRVSLPETTPTLRWTGKVGDASVFRVWGSQTFVCDASADKLSSRAVPCVLLGFPPDTPGTSGMGLVLGGRAQVVLTGHADASWVDDLATQRSSQGYTFSLGSGYVSWRSTRSSSVLSSSCEAEIYAGAMAAQELRWLTYLLTDLGEAPRSPPVLYIDNKAMLALCQEHRLEHRTKHIALRYFLARELQQRGQLRLAYVAARANTADVFTKALQPCDHQPCFAFLDCRAAPLLRAAPPCRAAPPGAEPRRPTEPRRPAEPRHPTEPHCPVRAAPAATAVSAATAVTTATAAMASPSVLSFDAKGRAVDFDVWVGDLQLFLQCDSKDGVSLFYHMSGVSPAPAATADSTVRSQWTTRDAVPHLPVRIVRYSSPSAAALSRLMLPYLLPDLAAFATIADLIASAVAVDLVGAEEVGAASAPSGRCRNSKGNGGRGGGGDGGGGGGGGGGGRGGGGGGGGGGGSGGFGGGGGVGGGGGSGGGGSGSGGGGGGGGGAGRGGAAQRGGFGGSQRQQQSRSRETPQNVAIFDLDFDAILAAMYAVTDSAEGDYYQCVPPDPGIEASALGAGESAAPGTSAFAAPGTSESAAPGACESALSGTVPTEALHTFTLEFGASRSFFRDSTTLTPLSRPVAVSLADLSGGPVLAHSSTVLPCPAAPSGLLSGLHLPSFSTNLVSGADLQDLWVDQFTPGGQRVTQCTCSRTGRHLATFTRRPGSSLYTPTTASPPVTVSGQVAASGQVLTAASRSSPASAPCCVVLCHTRLSFGTTALVTPPCLVFERAAPHSSEFPPTEAPLQTLHMDVWGPARVRGLGHERYFLLVVDDYSRYTTVFPLRRKDRGAEFSSDLLRAFCRAEGIRQTFTLPFSPQKNGIAERYIGMVMDVARTSMIHAAAPYFLWPFAVQYAAHQINLQPRVSLPETTPTLWWTRKVGDASVFRVWGSRAFVRNTSADKLSSCAVPCVFLGFPPDAPGWQFYHPTSRRVLSSQDVTFDKSVSYYHPVEVAVDSGTARGAEPAGAGPGGAEPGVAESEGAEPGGAEPEHVEPGGAEPRGAESGGAKPGGAKPERAESGGPPGVPSQQEPLSPQRLCEWYARRCRRAAGATGPTTGGASGAGAARGAAGAGAAGAAGPRGAGAGGPGAVGGPTGVGAAEGASGAGAAGGAAGAGAAGAAGPGGAGAGGTGTVGGRAAVGAAGGAGAAGPGGARTGGTRAARA
ncbi:unnamed protein product, partial [Closterium sp. NIES-53]